MLRAESAKEHAQVARASAFDDSVASERGRLIAARNLIEDPAKRVEMERQLGKPYCVLRWPEVYDLQAAHGVVEFIPRLNLNEPADHPVYDDRGLLIIG